MKPKLLLADDSITIQKVVELIFSNENFEIITVNNGADALVKAKAERPDIVLADIYMPKLDGYELCQEMKKDPDLAATPIILLVGAFESFDESRSAVVGATGHSTKPFESQELVGKVRETIEAAAAARSAQQTPRPPEPAAEDQWTVVDITSGAPPLPAPQVPEEEADLWKDVSLIGETHAAEFYPEEKAARPPAAAAEPQAEIFEISLAEIEQAAEAPPQAEPAAHTTLHGTPVTVYEEEHREEKVAAPETRRPIELSVSEQPMELQSFESLDEAHLLGAEFGVPPMIEPTAIPQSKTAEETIEKLQTAEMYEFLAPEEILTEESIEMVPPAAQEPYLRKEAPIAAPSAAAPMVDLDVTLEAIPIPPPPPPAEEQTPAAVLPQEPPAAPRAAAALVPSPEELAALIEPMLRRIVEEL
ncbi:MAG: response regulator, partial [Nitrospirae bacterium]|nr:response regulator [Nitrospirota bacterium]